MGRNRPFLGPISDLLNQKGVGGGGAPCDLPSNRSAFVFLVLLTFDFEDQ